MKGAKSYLFAYALIINGIAGEWQSRPSTKTNASIRNLIAGSQYSFHVAGVGADPVLTYSKL